MELNLISWNVNFIHDNWSNRLININNKLEKEIEKSDIICLQEATLPFSDIFTNIYKFLKGTDVKYFPSQELFAEKEYFYKTLQEYFPKYKEFIVYVFEKLMDKALYIIGKFYSYFGEDIKKIYFEHPFIMIILVLMCPLLFCGQWAFFGMLTLVNKKIKTNVKCKYIGRTIQYMDFVYNNKNITLVNIHLSPGSSLAQQKKRYEQILKILDFVKNKKNVILCGDFNAIYKSKEIQLLKKHKFVNCGKKIHKKNLKTFPSDKPRKCIDYFFVKGNIKPKNYELFGTYKETDHKGIKCTVII